MSEIGGDVDQDSGGHSETAIRIQSLERTIEELRQSQQASSIERKTGLFMNASEGNKCHLEDGTEVAIAGLGRRILGGFADRVLFGALYTLSFCLMLFLQSAIASILLGLFALLLEIGYQMTMLADNGQTIGRKIAMTRVVMFQNGRVPTAKAIVKRGAVSTGMHTLPWILLFPAAIVIDISDGASVDAAVAAFILWLAAVCTWCFAQMAYWVVVSSFLWNATGQGWHDRVAGTIVISTQNA